MKTKLTIKSIIRWEQLCGKSFSLMDYSNKDDVEALLYTVTMCNNPGITYTFDVFRQTLVSEKITRKLGMSLELETVVLNQFQKKQEATTDDNESSLGMIGDIISTLILSGLSADYVLNQMELCDLPMYLDAYERKKKEHMEEGRMWTYLSILPHIDSSKMRHGAKDLITFPWEEEETKKEAERAINEDADRLEEFMALGKSILKK